LEVIARQAHFILTQNRKWQNAKSLWLKVLSSEMEQAKSGPGYDPSRRQHSGIWGAAHKAVLNKVQKKMQKISPFSFDRSVLNEEAQRFLKQFCLPPSSESPFIYYRDATLFFNCQ
jgi:hypothetical protein